MPFVSSVVAVVVSAAAAAEAADSVVVMVLFWPMTQEGGIHSSILASLLVAMCAVVDSDTNSSPQVPKVRPVSGSALDFIRGRGASV